MNKQIFSLIVIYILLSSANTMGQVDNKSTEWPKYEPYEVPLEFESEDAIYLENIQTIFFTDYEETHQVEFKRVLINNSTAVSKFSEMNFFFTGNGIISDIRGRILKPDGSELILNNGEHIFEKKGVSKNKYGKFVTRSLQFLLPTLEEGDVIDFTYKLEYNSWILSDLKYLEDDLCSIHSRISIQNFSRLELNLFHFNNMPMMKRELRQGTPTITWEKNNVPALIQEDYCTIPPDLPVFVYNLWTSHEIMSYSDIYSYDEKQYPFSIKGTSRFTDYFKARIPAFEEMNIVDKLNKIIMYCKHELNWNYSENTQYARQTSEMINKSLIDDRIFLRLIIQFLHEQKVDYEKGFTKSLQDGQFIPGVVSFEQLTKRFLFIYDENENPHFLFPPIAQGNFYFVDEIPYYCEGNGSILLKGRKGFLSEESQVNLPLSSHIKNAQNSFISIDCSSSNLSQQSVKRRDSFTGHLSYLVRSQNGNDWLDYCGVQSDTSLYLASNQINQYPYRIQCTSQNDTLKCLTQLEDSLYLIDLSDLIPEGVFSLEEENMTVSNYMLLPFQKKHSLSFFIKNDTPIFLREEISKIEFSNSIGTVSAKVNQIDVNTLKLDYIIEVKERQIKSVDQQEALIELFTGYKDLKNKRWIIQIG